MSLQTGMEQPLQDTAGKDLLTASQAAKQAANWLTTLTDAVGITQHEKPALQAAAEVGLLVRGSWPIYMESAFY